jgi:hypothetical protein
LLHFSGLAGGHDGDEQFPTALSYVFPLQFSAIALSAQKENRTAIPIANFAINFIYIKTPLNIH